MNYWIVRIIMLLNIRMICICNFMSRRVNMRSALVTHTIHTLCLESERHSNYSHALMTTGYCTKKKKKHDLLRNFDSFYCRGDRADSFCHTPIQIIHFKTCR